MGAAFDTDDGAAHQAAIGLIVLATDETMEPEIASVMPGNGVALYHARIPSAPTVTAETLARMKADLPGAAGLLPDRDYQAIGYGCTSGATVIGPEVVAGLVRGRRNAAHVADPMTAVIAACRHLGVRSLGFLTPYIAEVSAAMRARLEAEGFRIAAFASFEEAEEQVVARISERSTLAAVLELGALDEVDAVFASCTNLRTFGVIAEAERRLGKPVISSNLALAWALLRSADAVPTPNAPGALFAAMRRKEDAGG